MKRFKLMVLLAIAAMAISDKTTAQCSGYSAISYSMPATVIPGNGLIWFAAALKVTGTPTYPLTIYFHSQTISYPGFSLAPSDGELILDPSYTHAFTAFRDGMWVTVAPPNEVGNYYISSAAYYSGSYDASVTVPAGTVTWSGTFVASQPGISLSWQWWASAFHHISAPLTEDGIKAADCISCTEYSGSAFAGWPVYTGGHFGGGTAGYTDSALVTPCRVVMPSVTITASATSVCTGDSITYTATVVNGGSAPSFQWKEHGWDIPGDPHSGSLTVHAPVSNEEISVQVISNDSVAWPPVAESNAIHDTVSPAPAPSTISGGTAVCTGGTLALSASAGGGVWSSSNTAIGTVSGSGVVTGVGSGTATISYTIANSCGAAVATQTVTASPAFAISGTLTSPTCSGYTNGSVVTSVAPRRGHTYTYAWSNGSTLSGLWGVGAGTYSVTATNEAGCAETAAYTVTQPETLASTYSVTDDYESYSNGAVYFGLSGGTWPYSYSWSNGATTQNITGLAAGTYVVTAIDANSCTLTNVFYVHETGGSGRMAAGGSASAPAGIMATAQAYPNPFSSETTISFSAPQNGHTTVEVYNVGGHKEATIFDGKTNAGQEYSCTLAGGQLASGVYFYKIVSADKDLYTGRVVLVK